MNTVQSPFPRFHDTDGSPLDGGLVYVGVAGQNPETSPVAVYWDEAGTQPAEQPLRTRGGYIVRAGNLAQIYAEGDDFSLTCKTSSGRLICYAATVLSSSTLRTDLSDTSSATKGAGLLGVNLTLNYASGTVGALLREAAVNVRGSPYYMGGVGVDDDAALQSAINDNLNRTIYIPETPTGGRDYLLDSGVSVPVGATCTIVGDESRTRITVTGDIVALQFTDVAGIKGGVYHLHFEHIGNTYSSGGLVNFANGPNSVALKLRDDFQTTVSNCVFENFGDGVLLNNYSNWCEGTVFENVWFRRNKRGVRGLRENAGTDSLSHTRFINCVCELARDNTGGVAGNWMDGLVIDGGGLGPLQIYNGFLGIHFFSGDGATAPHAESGNFVKLANQGRIAGSFIAWTFERYGKINIASGSYIDQPTCHMFLSALDATQLEIVDANATGSKFRSYYVGNISKNLNFPGAFANWRGSGNAGTYQHGESFSAATGHHYVNGTGISSHLLTHLSGSANGVFFASTPDHEGNLPLPHSYIVERGAYFPTLRTAHLRAAVTGTGPTSYTSPQAVGHFYLTGCVSPLTITLPSESVANDGQEVTYVLDQTVASLLWLAPNGAARTTLPASGTQFAPIRLKYSNADNAWYPT
jgi:hypothetical protein